MIQAMESMLWIQQKDRRIVPFRLNQTQIRILDACYEQVEKGLPIRLLELKGRQQGSSTGISGYMFMRTVCEPHTNSLIITEEKGGSAQNIYQMYERYRDHFPEKLETESTRQGQHLKLAEPLGSQIKVEGEKNVTSFTYQLVHLSEAAFFQNLSKTLAMLLQTVPDHESTAIILETTANQYGDDFHQAFERAREGKSDFTALFIPWYVHEEYQIGFNDDELRDQFRSELSQSSESQYGNECELLELHPDMTLENLAWRRNAIRNKTNGSIVEFNRQYPSSAEDAFVTSGQKVLDIGALQWYQQHTRPPVRRGQFKRIVDRIEWEDNPQGIVHLWEPPKPKREYIGASDHAEGLDSGDHNVGIIGCRLPRKIVAKIRGYDGRRVGTDEFADQFACLAEYYNRAMLNPENNLDGGRVIDLMMHLYKYGRLVREQLITTVKSDRFGWRNHSATQRRGVRLLQDTIQARDVDIPDDVMINQGLSLVWKHGKAEAEKKGQPRHPGEAEQGYYDDDIDALIGWLLLDAVLPAPLAQSQIEMEERMKYERLERQYRKGMPQDHYLRMT